MATPANLILKARRNTGSNSSSYIDNDAILDLNNRRGMLISRIQKEVDEGYFWDYGLANTVSGQSEYTISNLGSLNINQIDGVSVKFNSTDTYYTKLERRAFGSLDYDMQAYEDWAGTPFYVVKDRSVFIYPKPLTSVTNGLKIFTIQQPADVTTGSTEADMKIDPRFHTYIMWGMCADYWYANMREDKGTYWENMFNTGGDLMIKAMKNREQQPLEFEVSTNPYM